MKHTLSLGENRAFQRLYRSGKSTVTPYFAMYVMKNRRSYNRLGLTASKKIGNAVERNRARRLLRESYRLLEEETPLGYDIVLVARKKALYVKMQTVRDALRPALKGLGPNRRTVGTPNQ